MSRPACSWHQQKSTPIQKKMASLSAPRVRDIKRTKRRLLLNLHSRAPRPPPPPLRGVPRPFPSTSCIGALPFEVTPKSDDATSASFLLLTSVPPCIDGATGAAVSPAIAPGDAAYARYFRARAGAGRAGRTAGHTRPMTEGILMQGIESNDQKSYFASCLPDKASGCLSFRSTRYAYELRTHACLSPHNAILSEVTRARRESERCWWLD